MIKCTKFRSYNSGTLQGFCDFFIEKWGVEITGCSLHMKEGRRWINLPSKEYQDEEGNTRYHAIIRFKNREHCEAFIERAKRALDEYCKE